MSDFIIGNTNYLYLISIFPEITIKIVYCLTMVYNITLQIYTKYMKLYVDWKICRNAKIVSNNNK